MSRIKVFLPNGFRFSGALIDDSEQFLIIQDERSGNKRTFNKAHLESWEVTD